MRTSQPTVNVNKANLIEGKGKVIPGYSKFMIDDVNNEYNTPFMLNEVEIREAFSVLDVKKSGYITTEELAFFLDILGETPKDEELEEMIRMLDVEGSGRVRYNEFYKFATGQSLAPIGQAYPPTLNLLQKKNGIEADILRAGGGGRKNRKIDTSFNAGNTNGKKGNNLSNEMDDDRNIANTGRESDGRTTRSQAVDQMIFTDLKLKPAERKESTIRFIKATSLKGDKYLSLCEKIRRIDVGIVTNCQYSEFVEFFHISDSEPARKMYSLFYNSNTNGALLRDALASMASVVDIQAHEKLDAVFGMYDTDGSNIIVYSDFVRIIELFHFTTDPTKVERKIKAMFTRRGLRTDDIVMRDHFFSLAKEFNNIFFPMI
eukprot:TRINITY_DN5952_c0_g1_i2.p1 TRINITY_DN5952_c0_g1~~TRINITY_DN5952_c0_g1_i2.p1  ORF type:complete len:375 (+),score=73.67 TRINITY_DN5952_c0_g1_i2:797-1921(+)